MFLRVNQSLNVCRFKHPLRFKIIRSNFYKQWRYPLVITVIKNFFLNLSEIAKTFDIGVVSFRKMCDPSILIYACGCTPNCGVQQIRSITLRINPLSNNCRCRQAFVDKNSLFSLRRASLRIHQIRA